MVGAIVVVVVVVGAIVVVVVVEEVDVGALVGAAVVAVHPLGDDVDVLRRRRRDLVGLVARGAAGNPLVQARLAEQVSVLTMTKTRSNR